MAKKKQPAPKKIRAVKKRVQTPIALPKNKKKSSSKSENIFQALSETEQTIRDLATIFAQLPESGNRGINRRMELTAKEKVILNLLKKAESRAAKFTAVINKHK